MGLLDLNMDARMTLEILPDNTEARLRIKNAEITENRKDPSRSNLAITFDVPANEMVDDIRVWIPIPGDAQREEDPKAYAKAYDRIMLFLEAFDIPPRCPTEDMIGKEGWALVSEEEDRDGVMRNSVRKYLPKKR